jgi:prepilin-type N-terminal cleavage/methylation domain-containing protein/prepilin-type processing-associated H-X9-DG protein
LKTRRPDLGMRCFGEPPNSNPHPVSVQMGTTVSSGFTLIELLVVIAIIAILAALLLSSLSRAKAASQSVACLSNLKQLQLGYLMYLSDNNDWLPPDNARTVSGYVQNLAGSWVLGNAQRDVNTTNIQAGVIFRYVGAAGVYHCPADHSTVTGAASLPRTRSYSLDGWLNSSYAADGDDWMPQDYPWAQIKISTMHRPPPTGVYGFADENEQSIDAGPLLEDQPASVIPGPDMWLSLPSDRHRQGCNLSFLDGHVEHWRWLAPKVYNGFGTPPISSSDRTDLRRLEEVEPHDVIR